MKKYVLCLAVLCCCFSAVAKVKVLTGIEVLKQQNFKVLEGKRVGLVTNPTGVDNELQSDVDILAAVRGIKLVALFGPEHGVRGSAHAGLKVEDNRDEATGLPVYSLYGKYRVPAKEMLQGIDVLVYDIQDIGCRSFTYISTLGNIMKAAAENNIQVVVLDRPNPLGGLKIEGNITEDDCISFVSRLKIPYVYGLTVGELALMLNGENMLGAKCDLTVIKMKGWKRRMTYTDTGFPYTGTDFGTFLRRIGHCGRTRRHFDRRRLHASVPNLRCFVDKSARIGFGNERIEPARSNLPPDLLLSFLQQRHG